MENIFSEPEIPTVRGRFIARPIRRIPSPFPVRERYSTNPRRIDDPRKLDKMAMIKVGKKLIGVPMNNILRCNYDIKFKII
jgi:hypothetical protein